MSSAQTLDRSILASIVVILIITIGVHLYDDLFFSLHYAREDGIVEYGTALFLFVCSVVLFRNSRSLGGKGVRLAAVLTMVYALMFFLAAGEEISWGQRIFGWESGEFFQENNKQFETNFHNLVVGDLHLAKTLFGSVLTTVILLYLVVLPLLYPRVGFIQNLADRLAVPVPGVRHTVIALLASIVIAVMDQGRKWEVYELIFSLIMLSILLLPQNKNATR